MMRCPYNKNHTFKKEKLYKHLDHCMARKKTNKKLYFCKGNSMIVFFEEDKKAHQEKCKFCKPDYKEKEETFVSKFNNSETQIDLDIHFSKINNDKGMTIDLDLSNDFQSNATENKTIDFSKTCQDKTINQIKNESFAESLIGNILDSLDDNAQQSIYY